MLLQLRPLFPRRVPGGQVVCPFGPRVGGPKLTVCPATAHAPSRPRWLPFPEPAPAVHVELANIESRAPLTRERGPAFRALALPWLSHSLRHSPGSSHRFKAIDARKGQPTGCAFVLHKSRILAVIVITL